MYLLSHDDIEDVERSARQLKQLGSKCIILLSLCVEEQGVERRKLSKAGALLGDYGFVSIQEIDCGESRHYC